MATRSSSIVAAATARSQSYVDSLPLARRKFGSNCRSISLVCVQLLSLRPPRAPTSSTVSEEGRIHHADFPRKQTLDNTYGEILGIWRQAYAEIMDSGVQRSRLGMTSIEFAPSDLASLDAGTRANVQVLQALLREAQARNNRLSQFIRERVPYDDGEAGNEPARALSSQTTLFPPDIRTELIQLIGRLDNGSSQFQLDDAGVKVTRRSPVGTTIMSRLLFDALRALVANAT